MLARVALMERLLRHCSKTLCRQDHLIALPFEPTSDDLFCGSRQTHSATERVDIRSINEIDTTFEGSIQNLDGLLLVTLQAKRHRPKA